MPTTSFPRELGDPSGSFVLDMARALAERGHDVEVLAPEPASSGPWTRPARGVSVRWIPYARPRSLQRTFHGAGAPENLARDPLAWLGAPTFCLALDRSLAASVPRWDAIASHWGVPCGLLAGRRRGRKPHLALLHSGDVHAMERVPFGRALAARVLAGATHLSFASERLAERFGALLGAGAEDAMRARSSVAPMGHAATAVPSRGVARAALGLERFTLLAMGRLVPIKALERAIDAARATDVDLVIAGDGPERAHLARLAAGAPVRFVGVVSGEEKSRWLAAADALVVPSVALRGRTEGTPTVIVEALAAGLPVLASRECGVEALLGCAGHVFATDAELADAIVALRRDDARRTSMALAAPSRVAHLAWPMLAERFESHLRSA